MKDGKAAGSCSIACRAVWKGRNWFRRMTVRGAARVWGRTDPQFGESLLNSLSRTPLVPRTIPFPLSAFAPDPHLRLIGCCLASTRLASSLDPHLSIRPPSCVLRLVATCINAVSLLSQAAPDVFRRSPFHIARGRFWDQFRFRVLYHRLGSPRLSLYVAPMPSVSVFHDLVSHPLPIPSSPLTAPFQTTPYGLAVPWFTCPVSLVSLMPSTCRLSELPVV